MAASYIRIVFVVLISITILMLSLGFVVEKKANGSTRPISIMIGCCGALMAVLLVIAARLSISGTLITNEVFALFFQLMCALLCGAYISQPSKKERRRTVSVACLGLLSLAAVGVQIKNIQPVLDTLQTAGLLKPRDDYKPETNKDCPANLQSVYNAFEQYAELNDRLPDAAKWQDDTDFTSRIPQDEWLHCPAVSNRHDDKFGYALNDAIAGKKLNLNGKSLKSLAGAATTPLLYDSTNTNKNAHDAGTSLPRPGRHSGRNNILYLDGHVAAVAPK